MTDNQLNQREAMLAIQLINNAASILLNRLKNGSKAKSSHTDTLNVKSNVI